VEEKHEKSVEAGHRSFDRRPVDGRSRFLRPGVDFETARKLGACLARDYAADLFRLLVNYHDISASEAASRLGLHIRTAQEFLETLAGMGVLACEEVFERKRPYNRYRLAADRIRFDLDLAGLFGAQPGADLLEREVREGKGGGAHFSTARGGEQIASVSIWSGSGRERRERRISLTASQGRFLYHLPFPNAAFMTVAEIMRRAGVGATHHGEIADLLDLLGGHGLIEEHRRAGS
jgi:predicted transcriptional regulator